MTIKSVLSFLFFVHHFVVLFDPFQVFLVHPVLDAVALEHQCEKLVPMRELENMVLSFLLEIHDTCSH